MSNKGIDNRAIGKKLIEAAIRLDEALVEVLKVEVKRLKKVLQANESIEEFEKTNRLVKNIILALLITDDKIKAGMELYMDDKQHEE